MKFESNRVQKIDPFEPMCVCVCLCVFFFLADFGKESLVDRYVTILQMLKFGLLPSVIRT